MPAAIGKGIRRDIDDTMKRALEIELEAPAKLFAMTQYGKPQTAAAVLPPAASPVGGVSEVSDGPCGVFGDAAGDPR